MIKIAIMLALHNNPKQANIFINQCLKYEGAEVFIHIDKKGIAITDNLIKNDRVHILEDHFDVQWGDISQVKYVIALMRYIKKYEKEHLLGSKFDYISIHSGSDMLVKPMKELAAYLERDRKFAYLDCYKLPWKDWQYGGGLGRIALYWPKRFRKRLKRPSITHFCRAIYGRMYGWGILKGHKLPDIQFWGKSAWYTISGECMHLCLKYIEHHPWFLRFFETALCPDEIFFDTLVNIIGKGQDIQEHDNLMYDDMGIYDKKNVGSPKTMKMVDIEKIRKSGAFFARKFDMSVDNEVVEYYIKHT